MNDMLIEVSKALAINLQLNAAILTHLVGAEKATEIYKTIYDDVNDEFNKQVKEALKEENK